MEFQMDIAHVCIKLNDLLRGVTSYKRLPLHNIVFLRSTSSVRIKIFFFRLGTNQPAAGERLHRTVASQAIGEKCPRFQYLHVALI
jgi:hypothetical protein